MSPLTASQFIGNGYVMVGIVLMSSILQATFSQISTYLVNTEGLHVKVALQVNGVYVFHKPATYV